MESIHSNKEYKEEYKQQFRNMTDEQIEYHIGLEKVRNVIEGFDREHGINEIRKIIEEVKNEKQKLEIKKCSRCYKIKNCNEFTSPRKVCNTCLDDKKEYRRCKREGIERVKEEREPSKRDKTTMYNCPLCQCSVKLYKKAQHEKTKTHQRNIQQ